MSTSAPQSWFETEKDAVLAQLERILEHPAFKHSQRSVRFLRYVVEQALCDDHEARSLKERTLGAELFGLDPAYDTNQYTVVRNAATDVRKRLAMYYHEPGHESEIQIDLQAGSYMPSFHLLPHLHGDEAPHPLREEAALTDRRPLPEGNEPDLAVKLDVPIALSQPKQARKGYRLLFSLAAVLVLILAVLWIAWAAGVWQRIGQRRTTQANLSAAMSKADMSVLDAFWKPVLDDVAYEPVTIVCVEQLPRQPGLTQDVMPVGDALATADFARLLGLKEIRFRIAVANSISMTDLQASTVLLIGGPDNPWTSYLTEGLRFRFSKKTDSGGKEWVWIGDGRNPSRQDWSLHAASTVSGPALDYAIVARILDPKAGRWRVIAAGLDGDATGIAARFLIFPAYLKGLTGRLPSEWQSKNVEAVLAVPIINGEAGIPQVVAYEVW